MLKFLDPSLYSDPHQKLQGLSLAKTRHSTKICGTLFSSFCVTLPTNQPTIYQYTNQYNSLGLIYFGMVYFGI